MASFSAETNNYQNACNLIDRLELSGIRSNITAGGVAIHCQPDQVNTARCICGELGVSFSGGYTSHEQGVLLKSPDGFEHLKKVNSDAIAVIKEWKE